MFVELKRYISDFECMSDEFNRYLSDFEFTFVDSKRNGSDFDTNKTLSTRPLCRNDMEVGALIVACPFLLAWRMS
jgi:hypothetical protein